MAEKPVLDVDVLIVGGGAAGLTASMLLSTYGVDALLVSRHPVPSTLPKAHVLYQKTMEIFAEVGVADQVYARATPDAQWRYRAWYAGLAGSHPDAGRRIGRIECWHNPSWQESSPYRPANLPQARLEPVLKAHADRLSPRPLRFNHSFVSLEQHVDHVRAVIEDRSSGERYSVRAKYLLGCDGGRSIGEAVGVKQEGPTGLTMRISAHVTADLSKFARDHDVLLRAIKNPEINHEVLLSPVGPDRWGPDSEEWVWSMAVSPEEHRDLSDDDALHRMKLVMGLPDIQATVHVVSRWVIEGVVANRLRVENVFLLGDAAHRHSPTGGLGLNTAVQDAYNLCWKLLAVLRHGASDTLLDSYQEERAPIARRVVDRSLQNWGIQRDFNRVVGITSDRSTEERWQALGRLWSDDAADNAHRRKLHEFLATLRAEFDSLGITFGYLYRSGALMPDGTPTPEHADDPSIYRSSTRPGATVPASTLEQFNRSSSIFDITGNGRFVLIAGEEGEAWKDAGMCIAAETGLPLDVITIGSHDTDWIDWRFEWTKRREITPKGALLVRPDRFIAWRSMNGSDNHHETIKTVLLTICGTEAI